MRGPGERGEEVDRRQVAPREQFPAVRPGERDEDPEVGQVQAHADRVAHGRAVAVRRVVGQPDDEQALHVQADPLRLADDPADVVESQELAFPIDRATSMKTEGGIAR